MITENIKATGSLNVVLTGADGNVKNHIEIPNLVVSTGLAAVTSRLLNTATGVMSHMALGTGNTAAVKANTALQTELARVALSSSSVVTTTTTNDSVQFVAIFPAGTGTGAITEAGILNAASAGTMLCRTVFGVVNKDASDTLSITWKVIFA